MSQINKVVVVGGGAMGNGIAHVFACKNFQVTIVDIHETALEKAIATITKNLDRQVAKGTLSESQKADALAHLHC